MGSDIGKCGICGQVLLVIVNILFIILGIIAVAIGAWAIANGNSFSFVTGNNFIGGSALLIIIGCVVIIVAAVGMFGAMCKLRILLVIYTIVVLVCVILEIVAGILVFVYRDNVLREVRSFSEDFLIAEYNPDTPSSDVNVAVMIIQTTFSCCGFNNASDWADLNVDAITRNDDQPPFCPTCDANLDDCFRYPFQINVTGLPNLVTRYFNATTRGCSAMNTTPFLIFAIGAGVVGIIFGILEIIGIIIALLLCCCIHRANQQTVV